MAKGRGERLAARLTRGSQPGRARVQGKRFSKEHQPKRPRGRPKGAQNYFTREIKEALIAAVNEYGRDGKGIGGMKGFFLRMCEHEPVSVMSILRAAIPAEVSFKHEDVPPESYEDVQRQMQRLGLSPTLLEDLRTIKYHTPEQVLELTAEDGTADDESDGRN